MSDKYPVSPSTCSSIPVKNKVRKNRKGKSRRKKERKRADVKKMSPLKLEQNETIEGDLFVTKEISRAKIRIEVPSFETIPNQEQNLFTKCQNVVALEDNRTKFKKKENLNQETKFGANVLFESGSVTMKKIGAGESSDVASFAGDSSTEKSKERPSIETITKQLHDATGVNVFEYSDISDDEQSLKAKEIKEQEKRIQDFLFDLDYSHTVFRDGAEVPLQSTELSLSDIRRFPSPLAETRLQLNDRCIVSLECPKCNWRRYEHYMPLRIRVCKKKYQAERSKFAVQCACIDRPKELFDKIVVDYKNMTRGFLSPSKNDKRSSTEDEESKLQS